MSVSIPGFTPTTPPASTTPSTGLGSMTSSDFLNLMITQLQQQDPLDPTSSSDLLGQMSQIDQLQSSTTLNSTLSGLSLQDSISSAGNMLGKFVNGQDANGNPIAGNVIGISVQNQVASLNLDSGVSLPMSSITAVQPAPLATTPATTTSTAPAS
jgi:flagellar basal-body rod modification protein FlgD